MHRVLDYETNCAGNLGVETLGRSGDGSRAWGSPPFARLTRGGTALTLIFVLLGLSKPSYVYAAGRNHDPDGDSDGTRITVTRP
ncbi:MAG: hypothetical protein H0W97_09490 [Actinobacteria bacterium]|nr:hypothetical protein [Actinomycetota bacterium]